jgi:glutamyl-tRNA reductase
LYILCIGLNHKTASLSLREKLAFTDVAHPGWNANLQHILEMVLVSTCNRTELYATSTQPGYDEIEAFLSNISGVTVSSFHHNLYRLSGESTADHLYRVATGLDSLVIGEPQVLGQVTRSLERALEAGSCGSVLSTLFRSAIHAGKRARAETGISHNATSISSLAAALAAKEIKDLEAATVMVVGAGEMAELAVEALRKRGALQVTVINRTLKKAKLLAERWQASAFTFKHIEEWLLKADIVISSTSAPHAIITAERMEEIMHKRSQKPIIMVDIAVPRNIAPEVSRVRGVSLFDLDTLEQRVRHLLEARSAEVPAVEAIIAEEKAQFMAYMQTLDVLPLITDLRKQAETIRNHELEKTFHHLPGLTDVERKRIDSMTRALVKKLLASPTQRLRIEANCTYAQEFSTVARTLFDLHDHSDLCAFSKGKCPVSREACCIERPNTGQENKIWQDGWNQTAERNTS